MRTLKRPDTRGRALLGCGDVGAVTRAGLVAVATAMTLVTGAVPVSAAPVATAVQAAPRVSACTAPVAGRRDPLQPLLIAKRAQFWHVRGSYSSGIADVCFTFGLPGDIGVMGDWDGDGEQTPAVFRPSEGLWFISNDIFARRVDAVYRYGSDGDVPTRGDWNGDGTQTLGVFRAGRWYLTDNNDSRTAQFSIGFGLATDTPLGGTSQSGQISLTLYRRAKALMFTGLTTPSGPNEVSAASLPVGEPWDKLVAPEFLSCRTSAACAVGRLVFRPSDATWYLDKPEGGGLQVRFGNATDQPLVSPSY